MTHEGPPNRPDERLSLDRITEFEGLWESGRRKEAIEFILGSSQDSADLLDDINIDVILQMETAQDAIEIVAVILMDRDMHL